MVEKATPTLLNEIGKTYRRIGVPDILHIIESLAALLLGQVDAELNDACPAKRKCGIYRKRGVSKTPGC